MEKYRFNKYHTKILEYEFKKMTAGALYAFGSKTEKLFLIAHIGGETERRMTERYKNAYGITPTRSFHFTLLQIDINKNNNNIINAITNLSNHINILGDSFKNSMSNVGLTAGRGNYEKMGSAIAKPYMHDVGNENILSFWNDFHNLLSLEYKKLTKNAIIQSGERSVTKNNITLNYYIYRDGKTHEELYAVPEYYHKNEAWKPHISIIYENDVQHLRMTVEELQKKFEDTAQGPTNAISKIKLPDNIKEIELSMGINGISVKTPINQHQHNIQQHAKAHRQADAMRQVDARRQVEADARRQVEVDAMRQVEADARGHVEDVGRHQVSDARKRAEYFFNASSELGKLYDMEKKRGNNNVLGKIQNIINEIHLLRNVIRD
jgi:hypothetical protein